MTDGARTRAFAEALQGFESDHDSDTLLGQFADDAALSRPEADQSADGVDPGRFWREYRQQFDELATDFTRVTESGDLGLLEWTSTGRLATGRDITYRGVSILEFDDDDQVARFATYYDTAAFLEPTAG